MRRAPAPPLWFLLCVAVASAVAVRVLLGTVPGDAPAGGHAPAVQHAIIGFLIFVGSLIWKGLEVAGKVSLAILKWMVVNLSLAVTKIANGIKDIARGLLVGLHKTWSFFEHTYDHVIKPAWTKFWRWFDKFRLWLDQTFGPVLNWLRQLRDNLLDFWKTYVRPWLDLIDVTRRVLRVLSSLGLSWARELDRRLGAVEDAIERPFRLLLAKVNEVINLVNRVVTLDGLLQRVALIRSFQRDYKYAWNTIRNAYSRPLTGSDKAQMRDKNKALSYAEIDTENRLYMTTGAGRRAALYEELRQTLISGVRAR